MAEVSCKCVQKRQNAALDRALALYEHLSVALTERLAELRASGRHAEKNDEAAVKTHYQALMTVLNFETGLGNRRRGVSAAGAGGLNLAAAREEIAKRLACVRAAEGA